MLIIRSTRIHAVSQMLEKSNEWRFTVTLANEANHTIKASQDIPKANKWQEISQ